MPSISFIRDALLKPIQREARSSEESAMSGEASTGGGNSGITRGTLLDAVAFAVVLAAVLVAALATAPFEAGASDDAALDVGSGGGSRLLWGSVLPVALARLPGITARLCEPISSG
ncbi:hypothetical protein [Paraburkholderia sp. GAS199]|uniref:hypothetical protein n=1 Tax=Paraburkholderia sp. GAS199 TaxID=3035126 RepID=UPI003D2456B1